MFFELTQLSGLYGIYPRPYRLFDVDDLMLNTLGGIIGYILAPLFSKFLPKRERLDELSYIKGKKISIFRRAMATWIDLLSVVAFTVIFAMLGVNNLFLQYIFSILIIFMIVPSIRKGYTYGKKWMNIKIVDGVEEQPKWYQYWIRYACLYLFLVPMPFYCLFLLTTFGVYFKKGVLLLVTILGGVFLICLFHGWISLFTKKTFWYERISKTQNKSTIEVEECNES